MRGHAEQRAARADASLLALYILITIVRYVVEPRVIGTQLGLHTLVALMAMFAGLNTFGVPGLILGPTIAAVKRGSADKKQYHLAAGLFLS